MAERPVAEGKSRGAAAALRLGLSPEAGAPGVGCHRQWRHRHARWRNFASRACRRVDARPRRVPRAVPAASHRRGMVRRRTAQPRGTPAGDATACRVLARAGHRVETHHAPPAWPVPWRARRARIPPGAERRRAQAGRGLGAARGRACTHAPTGVARRMITRDIDSFLAVARTLGGDFGPATARAAFLVAPDGFRLAEQSARDNRYMAGATAFDPDRAAEQHRALHRALSSDLPTVCFPGDAATPDAVFPNNVFATAPGRFIVGRMRHGVRQREAGRGDIRGFFRDVLGYAPVDLSTQPHPCELTGALVIDRARGIGWCGLSERCDEDGARLMHEAFGLRATLLFDLAPGEYHTNVVLAVLAGRAAVVCPRGFADPDVPT